MRTYATKAPMSEAAKHIISDREASTKLLLAVEENKLPVTIEVDGRKYIVSRAAPC